MVFKNPYWSHTTQMSLLQRWLIVHSILYYELNNSIIEDRKFDNNSKQLVAMQARYPKSAKATEYWYAFYDFDGSTGFHLFGRLTKKDKEHLFGIAQMVLKQLGGSK